MLQWEHSAILLTCIKLPNDFKAFVLSFFEWPLKTGFTVFIYDQFGPVIIRHVSLYAGHTCEVLTLFERCSYLAQWLPIMCR